MNFYQTAPEWAIGIQCQTCDIEIAPTDRVYADLDVASDTGTSRIVRHVGCHVSIETTRANTFTDVAKRYRYNGNPDIALGLDGEARQIKALLSRHNEARYLA